MKILILLIYLFISTLSFQPQVKGIVKTYLKMDWSILPIDLKSLSRNWFITRSKLAGIPWDLYVNKRSNETSMKILNNFKEELENVDIEYPSYYTRPFHGYANGNLQWDAATEGEAATISISTNYWKNIDPYLSEKWLRNNITSNLENYIEYHDGLRLNDLINKNTKILDVGCSIGISTEYLKKEFDICNVEGLDLSPYFLSIAKMRSDENNLDIKYFHANAENIPKKDEYYDLITCNFLFHEVPKDITLKILQELKRVLSPNGILMITDLDRDILKDKLEKNKFNKWAFEITEPHIYDYYTTEMFDLLTQAGFSFISKVSNDPINSSWLAKKWS